MLTTIIALSACTHQNVDVHKIGDSALSCQQVSNEIVDLKILQKDIEDKTGFSGRNVGMGLLFWPAIIVNEMNASDAEVKIKERSEKLVEIHDKKKCDPSAIKHFEEKQAAEAQKAKEKAEKKAAKKKKN